MPAETKPLYAPEQFFPSLVEARKPRSSYPESGLMVCIPVKGSDTEKIVPQLHDRHMIFVSDGDEVFKWRVESLRSLFRGDKPAPTLGDLPSDEYITSLFYLETHVLEVSHCIGDRRDAEMKEIYSVLRRRPDGRSLGFTHDYMWQVSALLLGTRVLSQAEFEVLLLRLERSCRTFENGSSSRNYVATLRVSLPQD
jgi:hypothetical protein